MDFVGRPELSLAAGDLGGEGVERLCERRHRVEEVAEPAASGVDPGWIECVEPPRAVCPHGDQPSLAEHPEVLGCSRLGDPPAFLEEVHDRAGRPLPGRQQLEDAPADRLAQRRPITELTGSMFAV